MNEKQVSTWQDTEFGVDRQGLTLVSPDSILFAKLTNIYSKNRFVDQISGLDPIEVSRTIPF